MGNVCIFITMPMVQVKNSYSSHNYLHNFTYTIYFLKDVDTLNIYSEIQISDTFKPKVLMWSIDRNQGNNWYIARVSLNNGELPYDYRIIFEGKIAHLSHY